MEKGIKYIDILIKLENSNYFSLTVCLLAIKYKLSNRNLYLRPLKISSEIYTLKSIEIHIKNIFNCL